MSTKNQAQALGPLVDAHSAKRPERTTLRGRTVTLVPLDAEARADALFRGANGGEKDRAWTYLPYGPYADPAVFKASIAVKAQLNDALFFAILDDSTSEAVGHQAFHRIEPTHRVIEVGHILYSPGMQRAIGAEVLDVLVHSKRNKHAAPKLMRKLLKRYAFLTDPSRGTTYPSPPCQIQTSSPRRQ
jgi:RimJ/RimL family protein N-acetyltransferase